MDTRLVNGANGRAAGGRFAVGNAGGPGNPHVRETARLRSVLLAAVSDDDIKVIVAKLLKKAKAGDLRAIREVLDRTLGKSPAAVAIEIGGRQVMTPEEVRASLAAISERLKLRHDVDAVIPTPAK